MAIKLIITGENADEIYQQLMNLSKVPDFCYRPWEYNDKGKVIGHNDNVIQEKGAVYSDTRIQEDSKPAATIEPDTLQYSEPPKAAPTVTPAPAPKVSTPAPTASAPAEDDDDPNKEAEVRELQILAAQIGEKLGREVFHALKAQAGFDSMRKLDPAGRASFKAMMQERLAAG